MHFNAAQVMPSRGGTTPLHFNAAQASPQSFEQIGVVVHKQQALCRHAVPVRLSGAEPALADLRGFAAHDRPVPATNARAGAVVLVANDRIDDPNDTGSMSSIDATRRDRFLIALASGSVNDDAIDGGDLQIAEERDTPDEIPEPEEADSSEDTDEVD